MVGQDGNQSARKTKSSLTRRWRRQERRKKETASRRSGRRLRWRQRRSISMQKQREWMPKSVGDTLTHQYGSSTPQVHKTTTPPTQRDAHTHELALWSCLTLKTRSHGWVPAGCSSRWGGVGGSPRHETTVRRDAHHNMVAEQSSDTATAPTAQLNSWQVQFRDSSRQGHRYWSANMKRIVRAQVSHESSTIFPSRLSWRTGCRLTSLTREWRNWLVSTWMSKRSSQWTFTTWSRLCWAVMTTTKVCVMTTTFAAERREPQMRHRRWRRSTSESGTYTLNADIDAALARVDWFSLDSPMEEGEFHTFHGYHSRVAAQLHAEHMLQRWLRKSIVTLVLAIHHTIKLLRRRWCLELFEATSGSSAWCADHEHHHRGLPLIARLCGHPAPRIHRGKQVSQSWPSRMLWLVQVQRSTVGKKALHELSSSPHASQNSSCNLKRRRQSRVVRGTGAKPGTDTASGQQKGSCPRGASYVQLCVHVAIGHQCHWVARTSIPPESSPWLRTWCCCSNRSTSRWPLQQEDKRTLSVHAVHDVWCWGSEQVRGDWHHESQEHSLDVHTCLQKLVHRKRNSWRRGQITSPGTMQGTRSSDWRPNFQCRQRHRLSSHRHRITASRRSGLAKVDCIVTHCTECKDPTTRWTMLVELVWRRLVNRATRVPTQIWSATKRKRAARTRAALTQSYNDVKTSHKDSRREVVSGDRGHGAGRSCCRQHRRGKERKRRLHQVREPVERCTLTTRHKARPRPGAATTVAREDVSAHGGVTTPSFRGMRMQTPKQELEATHRPWCTIADTRWHSHRVDHAWDGDVTDPSPDVCHSCRTHGPLCRRRDTCKAPTRLATTASLFHSVQESRPTRSARRWRVGGKAASVPRAARGAACGRRSHVGQHVSNEDLGEDKASQSKRWSERCSREATPRANSSKRLDKICNQNRKEELQWRGARLTASVRTTRPTRWWFASRSSISRHGWSSGEHRGPDYHVAEREWWDGGRSYRQAHDWNCCFFTTRRQDSGDDRTHASNPPVDEVVDMTRLCAATGTSGPGSAPDLGGSAVAG